MSDQILEQILSDVREIKITLNGENGLVTKTALNTKSVKDLAEHKAEKADVNAWKKLLWVQTGIVLLAAFKVWWPA